MSSQSEPRGITPPPFMVLAEYFVTDSLGASFIEHEVTFFRSPPTDLTLENLTMMLKDGFCKRVPSKGHNFEMDSIARDSVVIQWGVGLSKETGEEYQVCDDERDFGKSFELMKTTGLVGRLYVRLVDKATTMKVEKETTLGRLADFLEKVKRSEGGYMGWLYHSGTPRKNQDSEGMVHRES